MKSLLVAAFTVGVGVPAGVAITADSLPPVAAPVAIEAPVHNWTGLSLGHGGGDFNSPVALFPTPMPASSMF